TDPRRPAAPPAPLSGPGGRALDALGVGGPRAWRRRLCGRRRLGARLHLPGQDGPQEVELQVGAGHVRGALDALALGAAQARHALAVLYAHPERLALVQAILEQRRERLPAREADEEEVALEHVRGEVGERREAQLPRAGADHLGQRALAEERRVAPVQREELRP